MKTILAFFGALALATSASAAPISYTFNADGITDVASQAGTAVFTFSEDMSTLTIDLTNNTSPTALIRSELDGLTFSLSAAAGASLASVGANGGVVDCSIASDPCPAGAGSTPFGWGLTGSGGASFALGAGFSGGTFSHQPYGIVNSNFTGSGELSSPSTNPLLVGPVRFTINLTGLPFIPEVTDVAFLFGAETPPDSQPGIPGGTAIPEPGSVVLLGLGLIALGMKRRRA